MKGGNIKPGLREGNAIIHTDTFSESLISLF